MRFFFAISFLKKEIVCLKKGILHRAILDGAYQLISKSLHENRGNHRPGCRDAPYISFFQVISVDCTFSVYIEKSLNLLSIQ